MKEVFKRWFTSTDCLHEVQQNTDFYHLWQSISWQNMAQPMQLAWVSLSRAICFSEINFNKIKIDPKLFAQRVQIQNPSGPRGQCLSKFQYASSVCSSNEIWWYRLGAALVQITTCCLMAPNHYQNEFWPPVKGFFCIHLGSISHEIANMSISTIYL